VYLLVTSKISYPGPTTVAIEFLVALIRPAPYRSSCKLLSPIPSFQQKAIYYAVGFCALRSLPGTDINFSILLTADMNIMNAIHHLGHVWHKRENVRGALLAPYELLKISTRINVYPSLVTGQELVLRYTSISVRALPWVCWYVWQGWCSLEPHSALGVGVNRNSVLEVARFLDFCVQPRSEWYHRRMDAMPMKITAATARSPKNTATHSSGFVAVAFVYRE